MDAELCAVNSDRTGGNEINAWETMDSGGWLHIILYFTLHLHWLLTLGKVRTLSTVIGGVKSVSARRAGCHIWQSGFHDYAVRREEDLVKLARYTWLPIPCVRGWSGSWVIISIGMRFGCKR